MPTACDAVTAGTPLTPICGPKVLVEVRPPTAKKAKHPLAQRTGASSGGPEEGGSGGCAAQDEESADAAVGKHGMQECAFSDDSAAVRMSPKPSTRTLEECLTTNCCSPLYPKFMLR